MLIEAGLVVIALIVFAFAMLRKYLRSKSRGNLLSATSVKEESHCIGIVLDTSSVQREFRVGEAFNSNGLIVLADYTGERGRERITDYVVDRPRMDAAGPQTVTVRHEQFTMSYEINITAPVEEQRNPVWLMIDADGAPREFKVGEEFRYDGLVVSAYFDREPFTEEVTGYEVIAPDMSIAGEATVEVNYQGLTASYPITIAEEAPVEEIAVAAEEDEEVTRYDRSFTARLILSTDETKRYYSAIKNELLSYKKAHSRMSWKRETFRVPGGVAAKLGYRGNTLCLYLPLDPAEFKGTRYKVEDVSESKSFGETPCMFRIRNEKRLRLSSDLIALVMEKRGIAKTERPEEDYYLPYRDIETLVEEGLVRSEVKAKSSENFFNKD